MKNCPPQVWYYQLGIISSNLPNFENIFLEEQKIYFYNLIISELYNDVTIVNNNIVIQGELLLKLINKLRRNSHILHWEYYFTNIERIKRSINNQEKYVFSIGFIYFEPYDRMNKDGIFVYYNMGLLAKTWQVLFLIMYIAITSYLLVRIMMSFKQSAENVVIIFEIAVFLFVFLFVYYYQDFFLWKFSFTKQRLKNVCFLLKSTNWLCKIKFDEGVLRCLYQMNVFFIKNHNSPKKEVKLDVTNALKYASNPKQTIEITLLMNLLKKDNTEIYLQKY